MIMSLLYAIYLKRGYILQKIYCMMKLKDFSLFEEELTREAPPKSHVAEPNRGEPKRVEPEAEPKTKDMKLGELKDGTEVMCKMKVGHTIVLDADEFRKLRNMKVSQYERDMLAHYRGGRDYRISKEKDGTYTIFHYNKTIHELTPVGVFSLPEKREMSLKESSQIIEFGFFKEADKKKDEQLLKKLRVDFPDIDIPSREVTGKSFFVATSTKPMSEIVEILGKAGISKEEVHGLNL
jgi:hypothetical protein